MRLGTVASRCATHEEGSGGLTAQSSEAFSAFGNLFHPGILFLVVYIDVNSLIFYSGSMRTTRPAVALTDPERADRLRLARTFSIGPVTFRRLLERFQSAAEALRALPDLARQSGAE